MARKKSADNQAVDVQYKTLEELTDGEFLLGADRLSVPFYLDYLSAPIDRNTSIDGYLSDTQVGILAKNAQTRLTTTKRYVEVPVKREEGSQTDKKYTNKRVGVLVVIVLLSLLLLLVAVLGVASPALAEYISIFRAEEKYVTALDPVFGLVDSLAKTNLAPGYGYFGGIANAYEAIPVYAVSAATVLFFLCVLIIFIKSLVALFEREKEDGYYKKRMFGFASVVASLCACIVLVGALYMTGGDITAILSFVKPATEGVTARYGLYAMIALPVLMAILSGCAYKKMEKKGK